VLLRTLADGANAKLLQLLSQGHEISREALDEILTEVIGAPQDNRLIREQMVAGFFAALKLVVDAQRHSVEGAKLDRFLSGNGHEVGEGLSALVQENAALLASEGLVTQEAVRDELVRLFADDVRTLLAIAQPSGFPKGWVNTNAAPIQSYHAFLETLEGLPGEQRARVARALAMKKRGSALLDKWAAICGSFAQGVKP